MNTSRMLLILLVATVDAMPSIQVLTSEDSAVLGQLSDRLRIEGETFCDTLPYKDSQGRFIGSTKVAKTQAEQLQQVSTQEILSSESFSPLIRSDGSILTVCSVLTKTTGLHRDKIGAMAENCDNPQVFLPKAVDETIRTAFVFLEDNPAAHFHYDKTSIPVKAGTMVVFDGRIPHQTVIADGQVKLLGPFDPLSFRKIGGLCMTDGDCLSGEPCCIAPSATEGFCRIPGIECPAYCDSALDCDVGAECCEFFVGDPKQCGDVGDSCPINCSSNGDCPTSSECCPFFFGGTDGTCSEIGGTCPALCGSSSDCSTGEDCCLDPFGFGECSADTCPTYCFDTSECSVGATCCIPDGAPYGECSGVGLACPTEQPSQAPSQFPSQNPSPEPSEQPSENPSTTPSQVPSESPSQYPSATPSQMPSPNPSAAPSPLPSPEPSSVPSPLPSPEPSSAPSPMPSQAPSGNPSPMPSETPSRSPLGNLTPTPSSAPSKVPSKSPEPSLFPSVSPSMTFHPSHIPSVSPTTDEPTPVVSIAPTAEVIPASLLRPERFVSCLGVQGAQRCGFFWFSFRMWTTEDTGCIDMGCVNFFMQWYYIMFTDYGCMCVEGSG